MAFACASRLIPALQRCGRAGVLAIVACVSAPAAWAADFPSRPLRFAVCTPAGGQIDFLARLVAEKMPALLGQSAIVENKPGAVGRIAASDVLLAPADGHTVLFCGMQIVVMDLFYKQPGYVLGKDLITASIMADNAGVIAVSAGVPAKNLREFIAYAKANPGKVNFVSYGNHPITLGVEAFNTAQGLGMVPIPFAGTAPMLTGLVQGDMHFVLNSAHVFRPLVDRNQVRMIATIGPQRVPGAPDVPTAAEQGFPEFIAPSWYAGFLRGGVSPEVVERINKALNAAVRLPDVRARLEANDSVTVNMSLDEINREIQAKHAFFSKIATQLKIDKQ